jgi:hypothetical protein
MKSMGGRGWENINVCGTTGMGETRSMYKADRVVGKDV